MPRIRVRVRVGVGVKARVRPRIEFGIMDGVRVCHAHFAQGIV